MTYKELPPRIKKMVKPIGRRYALVFCGMIVDIYDTVDEVVAGLIGLERMLPKYTGGAKDAPRSFNRT